MIDEHTSGVVDDQTQAIRVVPIAEQFIEGFHSCLDAVARERNYLALLQAPPLAAAREFVLRNLAQDIPQFVAVTSHHNVIGWCDITPHQLEGFSHCGHLGMGVRQDYRGRGIGRALIVATIEKARQQGLERIELEVFASNMPAIQLYKKVGFVSEGTKRRARKIDAAYDDIFVMACLF
jgi:ribosomal protein S18 acetylase RimI-like enzyme